VAAGKKLQALGRGIAANYEDNGVLADQYVGLDTWLHSPAWAAGLALPPVLYAVLLACVLSLRRRHADPAARRARRALREARRQLRQAGAAPGGPARVLEVLREYFGAKLRLTSGALVFGDVETPLRAQGITDEELAAIKELFRACEAGHYAGTGDATVQTGTDLAATARRLLDTLDRKLTSP
jgi:hypothetical protein